MNIKEFSFQLQSLYDEMAKTFGDFQRKSELPCLPECTKCCLNPEVEATPLEMIPMALAIFESPDFEIIYEKLSLSENLPCLMMDGKKCTRYEQRPSVCRMFGVAGYFDKNHQKSLSVCKIIKEAHPEKYSKTLLLKDPSTPMMADWFSRLKSLHPQIDQNRQSLNSALKIALEKIALWYQIKENSSI